MRAAVSTVAFLVLIIAVPASASRSSNVRSVFVEPTRGFSLEVPKGWRVSAGFGETFAVLEGPDDLTIKVIGSSDGSGMSGTIIRNSIVKADPTARFEAEDGRRHVKFTVGRDAGRKGVAISGGDKGCAFAAICEGGGSGFAETFLACRHLVRSAGCNLTLAEGCRSQSAAVDEIPTPRSFEKSSVMEKGSVLGVERASMIALIKGVFALLDGRAACHGVRDDVLRMAEVLKGKGCANRAAVFDDLSYLMSSPDDASRLERFAKRTGGNLGQLLEAIALEANGRRVSAARIYEKLARGSDGFFAALRLARLRMDGDDVGDALEVLSHMKDRGGISSNLMAALDLDLARAYGDRTSALGIIGGFNGVLCGESGASASYTMGMMAAPEDPAEARRYFEIALDADPGFAPAYPALGRALVESGMTSVEARGVLQGRLAKAPRTAELVSMRGRLEELLKSPIR